MDSIRIGVALAPLADPPALRALATAADATGLDLLGLPDHPYSPKYLDTLVAAADVLARTTQIGVFTDVANLPLRPAAVLAKAAASLDLLSGGRFDLGLGAGQAWEQIAKVGGPVRRPPEAIAAIEEAVTVLRALWRTPAPQQVDGDFYRLDGAFSGPAPTRPIGIWVGAVFPRMLRLTGRIGDGWAAPIPPYLPYEKWLDAQDRIDAGAADAGRDARDVRRIAQVVGSITERDEQPWTGEGSAPLRLSARGWIDVAERLVDRYRFDDVVFWPERPSVDEIRRLGEEVAPLVRDAVPAAG